MHSINDELSVLSFASVLDASLDASALAARDFRESGFTGGKTCSVGATSVIGFSRSKCPLPAHPARAKASSVAGSCFIFAPVMGGPGTHQLHHALAVGSNGMNLRGGLLIS